MIRKILFLVVWLPIFPTIAGAQIDEDISLVPILSDANYYCTKMMESDDYLEINKMEIDLVSSENSRLSPIMLFAGKTYDILLFGEFGRINSMDLKIYDYENDTKTLIKTVNSTSKIIEIKFKPTLTQFYEFEMIATKFASGYTIGRYCLIIGVY
jgi:hypothetical protein